MTQEELAAFFRYLIVDCGYRNVSMIPGDRYACLAGFMHTVAIITGKIGDRWSVSDRWCYHDYESASAALAAWDGEGEPKGWFRQPMTGRRISESLHEFDDEGNLVGAVGVEYVRR